ncbi:MAG: hypothetical protein ACRD36_01025 [Candidatus Acidiferrum sp.]
MFETPKEVKPDASKGLWIGIVVVVLVVATGGYFYMQTRGAANKPETTMAGAAAQGKGNADAVRDLKIQHTSMNKDRNGAISVWSVTIENKSTGYSYSNIKYETTYIGGDGKVLMVNKGAIAEAFGPGEEKSVQVNDPVYPEGTVRYNMKITGATPAAQ